MNAKIDASKLNEKIAALTLRKYRKPKNDPWKAAADHRRCQAITTAAAVYEMLTQLDDLARDAYEADPDAELEYSDSVVSRLAHDAEQSLLNLILEPQQDLQPKNPPYVLSRVRCRPAAVVVGERLYTATPSKHCQDDPVGTVGQPDSMMMVLHVVDLVDVQRHG